MATKTWWTVFGVYDEDERPLIEFIEAKDKGEARSKVLRKVDGVILIAGIAPGKVTGAEVDDLDTITPIRGKHHEIEVNHVRITRRKFLIPARCPKCKTDLRRADALREKFLQTRHWTGHLSNDGKTFVHERDHVAAFHGETTYALVDIVCRGCQHVIWDGFHADE